MSIALYHYNIDNIRQPISKIDEQNITTPPKV
jgi:hypothetical protein